MFRPVNNTNDGDVKPVTTNAMDNDEISDPSIDTRRLPEEYPVHLIDEARMRYQRKGPPFALRKRSERARFVEIPTASGKRPAVPTKSELVARPWDEKTMFWTLDLNLKRYIVKPFGGAPGYGHKYPCWDGEDEGSGETAGFNQQALAFSAPRPQPADSSDRDSDIEPTRVRTSGHADTSLPTRFVEGSPEPETTENSMKRGKKADQDNDFVVPNAPAKRQRAGISARGLNLLQEDNSRRSRRSSAKTKELMATESSPSPERAGFDSEISHTAAKDVATPFPPPITLSEYKQNHTLLYVRKAPSNTFLPIRLAHCPDARSLHAEVLKVWNVPSATVHSVTVSFRRLDPDDRMRTMLINPHQEPSFAYLLEQVDECPCWADEKGKCEIGVDITSTGSENL